MKRILLLVCLAMFMKIAATPGIYYYKSVGHWNTLSSWGENTDGTGTAPTTFAGAQEWHFSNRTGTVLTSGFTPPNTAKIVIEPGFNLSISGFAGSINEIIDIKNGGTLTLLNSNNGIPLNFGTLDVNSTVVYNTSSAVVQIPNENFGNLVIAESISCGPNLNSFYVYGLLTINATKTLTLNGSILRSESTTGSFAGSGFIRGSASSGIQMGGGNGGNNGTINFAGNGGNVLEHFFVTFVTSSTDKVLLGTDLEIAPPGNWGTGVFYHVSGSFDLNGHMLKIQAGGDLTLPLNSGDGFILANSTSSLIIEGTVDAYAAGSSILYMDPSSNTIGNLTINSADALDAGNSININNVLDIKGAGILNTNNNVTLVSTSALKGRLADITNGTLNGNLKVQTFAKGGTTDWAVIGSSGISGLTLSSWDNPASFPMTCIGCINATTSVSGGFASAIRYDETLADPANFITMNSTDPLTPGKGFWMYMGLTQYTTADMNWTVNGPAVTGMVSVGLTSSNPNAIDKGFNLIANPYPSPISWSLALASNPTTPVNDAIYIYNADHSTTTSYVNGTSSHASGGANDVIPMGQAFYVETPSATTFNFFEGNKVAANTSANELLKSSNSEQNNASVGSVIRLKVSGAGGIDETAIRFHSSATQAFDKTLDARKIYGSPGYPGYPGPWKARTVIGTQSNNEDYSINSLPYAQTLNAVIPVIVRVYGSGQHTISGSDLQNLPPNACVTLKDKLLNVTQDLKLGNYVCNINDTTYAARFELTVCADITADVKSNTAIEASSSIAINKDAKGIFVDFDFKNTTKANITVTNILGQRIMDTKKVKVTNENVYLDLNVNDQLIFVTVETENEKVTKKFLNFR